MRAVIQRVKDASVSIGEKEKARIGTGLVVFLGIEEADTIDDVRWLSSKIVQLRIFDDANGVMNVSVRDMGGDILLISQFTLYASTKKGNRPSYIRAASPGYAIPLYEQMIAAVTSALGKNIGTGEFQADMQVSLLNDGPVTIVIDSRSKE